MKATDGRSQAPFFQVHYYQLNLEHHLNQEEAELIVLLMMMVSGDGLEFNFQLKQIRLNFLNLY